MSVFSTTESTPAASAALAWREGAVDPASADRLAGRGLAMRRVDAAAVGPWLQAVARGFQGAEITDTALAHAAARHAQRRATGVFDDTAPMAEVPVGTVTSWIGALSLPGGAAPTVAISDVTVAQTHRRRGIARAMLEGELRSAAAAGVPLASLTVSESTLYGRYGFGAATTACTLTIDVKRAAWVGPVPTGRVDALSRTDARAVLPALHERTRLQQPGELSLPPGYEDRFTGTAPDDTDGAKVRCLRYTDDAGDVQGLLTYRVSENPDDFTKGNVDVVLLLAATDDAYAALWRFLVELDLVQTVRAPLRSVDEPVVWMVNDPRALTRSLVDHEYLRVLDVAAALSGRRYERAGSIVLEVSDPLGLAAGRYRLEVDETGTGTVTAAADDDEADLVLAVAELSTLLLGSVRATTLARAGRVGGSGVARASALLSWAEPAVLGYWY